MSKKYFIIRTYLGYYTVEEAFTSKKAAKDLAKECNQFVAENNEDLEPPNYFVTKRLED